MDRFLDSFQERPTPQKVLIIVGATAIFLLLLVILYFVTTPPRTNTNQAQNSQVPQVTPIPIKTTNTSPPNSWETEKNPSYKIDYPPTWKRQVIQVNSGGTLTSLTVPYSSPAEAFPRIDIQVTPSGTNITNQQRVINLSPLNLASSEATFKEQTAVKLTGTLPFDFVVGTVQKKVNKTFLFFSANGKDYVIDYAYYQDDTAEESIKQLNQILNTLKLQ